MYRVIGTVLVLAAAVGVVQGQGQPQPQPMPKDVTRNFDMGPLSKYFRLVKAQHIKREAGDPPIGGFGGKKGKGGMSALAAGREAIILRLEALKDLNPSSVSFKAGIFDKDRLLLGAVTVYLSPDFPLKGGESIQATIALPTTLPEGHRLVIRQVTPDPDSGMGGFKKKKEF